MIKILIPDNNIRERKYILEVFFEEFLQINYTLEIFQNLSSWQIELDNKKKIFFEDHFFNQYPNNLDYLNLKNIPKKVNYFKNKFISKDNIPVIYGNSKLEIKDNLIICGIDIFASSFFMLTRWEEYVNKNRDFHDRFSATESLAYKNSFLDRPIVNEYIKMLRNIFLFLDKNIDLKFPLNKLYLSHDIDELYKWKNLKQVAKVAIGDLIKRKNLSLALERFAEYFLICKKSMNDPFDTFDWLMDLSEANNLKSRFYFMAGGESIYDNRYSLEESKINDLIQKIKNRSHTIGLHPSYNAYKDANIFSKEKKLLEKISKSKIIEGRGHFLRFEVPTTWQIWEDNGMKIDSTCGYADCEGFRCGTGEQFSVFNILTRKKLNLMERPLVIMDSTLFQYKNYNEDKAEEIVNKLINQSSSTTILWHNSSINNNGFYRKILFKKA